MRREEPKIARKALTEIREKYLRKIDEISSFDAYMKKKIINGFLKDIEQAKMAIKHHAKGGLMADWQDGWA